MCRVFGVELPVVTTGYLVTGQVSRIPQLRGSVNIAVCLSPTVQERDVDLILL